MEAFQDNQYQMEFMTSGCTLQRVLDNACAGIEEDYLSPWKYVKVSALLKEQINKNEMGTSQILRQQILTDTYRRER